MKKLVNLTPNTLRVGINRTKRIILPGSFIVIGKNAHISGCLVATDIAMIRHADALLIPANQDIPKLQSKPSVSKSKPKVVKIVEKSPISNEKESNMGKSSISNEKESSVGKSSISNEKESSVKKSFSKVGKNVSKNKESI